MGHIPMRDHWKRVRWAWRGLWRPEYEGRKPNGEPARKSPIKRWAWLPGRLAHIPETSHALKNVLVEWLREFTHWRRKGKHHEETIPYDWPTKGGQA